LITLAVLAAVLVPVGAAFAQAPFPTPLASEAEACKSGYLLLRKDAVEKGNLIKAAIERHAPPQEACRLIANYSTAEDKVIQYLEANANQCRTPEWVADQLKADHKNTEALRVKVCAIAEQGQKRGIPGQINDFGDPAFEGYQTRQPRGPVGDFRDPVTGRF
jgi:hypothetical protein